MAIYFKQCIIFGRQQSTCWLQLVLEQYFGKVYVVESWQDVNVLPQKVSKLCSISPLLITDTCQGFYQMSLVEQIKKRIDPCMTICLVDEVDVSLEMRLRSLGLIFLGSYMTFLKQADSILAHGALQQTKLNPQ